MCRSQVTLVWVCKLAEDLRVLPHFISGNREFLSVSRTTAKAEFKLHLLGYKKRSTFVQKKQYITRGQPQCPTPWVHTASGTSTPFATYTSGSISIWHTQISRHTWLYNTHTHATTIITAWYWLTVFLSLYVTFSLTRACTSSFCAQLSHSIRYTTEGKQKQYSIHWQKQLSCVWRFLSEGHVLARILHILSQSIRYTLIIL